MMTPMERTATALSFKEPDRVPLFFLFTTHGAKELSLSIQEYFNSPQAIIEGQVRLQKKFQHDCFYAFRYASAEMEAWGMESIFYEDGPPNAGAPLIHNIKSILSLKSPEIESSPSITKTLEVIEGLSERSQGNIPIIGVVISPFSLPIMQLGFEHYLNLLIDGDPKLLDHLLTINKNYCLKWAQAQVKAGAHAIVYFDPILSTHMLPRPLSQKIGLPLAHEVLGQIPGLKVVHFASGQMLPNMNDVIKLPCQILSASHCEDLGELKRHTAQKVSLMGNMEGESMAFWTPEEAREGVKKILETGAPGGGFILSDNHGEIPYNTPDDVLFAIKETVIKYGSYPKE